MVEMWKLHGRLGNQMFVYAFCYAYAKEHGTDIFFQDPKYFEKYANEIKSIFGDTTWGDEPFLQISGVEPVSLHVRRGDYVGNGFYIDLMQTDYYQKAMAEFPGRKFLLFSDDTKWCMQQEIFKGCIASPGTDEIQDMNLMMRCNGHIGSNSTFSWWGSYLGKGKCVFPSVKNWYADGVERTVCPDWWIRI